MEWMLAILHSYQDNYNSAASYCSYTPIIIHYWPFPLLNVCTSSVGMEDISVTFAWSPETKARSWSREKEQPNTEEAWLYLVLRTLVNKSIDQERTTKRSRTFLSDQDSWSWLQVLVWAIYKWLPLVLLGTARSVKFVMAETRSGLDSMPLGKILTPWTWILGIQKKSPY